MVNWKQCGYVIERCGPTDEFGPFFIEGVCMKVSGRDSDQGMISLRALQYHVEQRGDILPSKTPPSRQLPILVNAGGEYCNLISPSRVWRPLPPRCTLVLWSTAT
jgi:hypothetical protein